jgi:hypothetical protein
LLVLTSVADPHSFAPDPDPAFIDPDLDTTKNLKKFTAEKKLLDQNDNLPIPRSP